LILDPILSILTALFILLHAAKLLNTLFRIFLQAVPSGSDPEEIRNELCKIDGVQDIHHIHRWSLDGNTHAATMHVVAPLETKPLLREKLESLGIPHVTLEFEREDEPCPSKTCHIPHKTHHHHH
jgi:cobalt-zinc-cadmium efflux system protein